MRNAHWVCKLCSGGVWKGLPALRRQQRGLWEHDDGNGTAYAGLAPWNGAFCENMSWSFSFETMYFRSGPTLGGHQCVRVNGRKNWEWRTALFLFWGAGGVTISQCLKEREVETTVRVDKSAKTDAVLFLAIDAYLCSIKREKDGSPLRQQWSLLMDHEWPLIVIHPN